MARRKERHGGEYVGKIGGVILSSWKGKAYLKAVPAGYKDRKSKSQ